MCDSGTTGGSFSHYSREPALLITCSLSNRACSITWMIFFNLCDERLTLVYHCFIDILLTHIWKGNCVITFVPLKNYEVFFFHWFMWQINQNNRKGKRQTEGERMNVWMNLSLSGPGWSQELRTPIWVFFVSGKHLSVLSAASQVHNWGSEAEAGTALKPRHSDTRCRYPN